VRFEPSRLQGLLLAQLEPRGDNRGSFARLYCEREMAAAGITTPIVQINHSYTRSCGTIRGLHFQHPPAAETKMIRCLRGAVWDVAVDLRAGSPTFCQWQAFELRADQQHMVIIPEGFAHGFQTLSDDAELLYLHTACYAPDQEAGFSCVDPRLSIQWPLPMTEQSVRDAALPNMPATFSGLTV
jgi:dTDP-4-dehydrorhamnose 3,5-epimerase